MKHLLFLALLASAPAQAANLGAATDLELLRGHLYASVSNYNAGSLQWGKKHAGHSLEELWGHLSPSVRAGERAPFEAGLQAIMAAPGTLAPGQYEALVQGFLAGPWQAAWKDAAQDAGRDFEVGLTSSLLASAKIDYAVGINENKPGEVQDAAGFLARALPHAQQISPQAARDVEALQVALLQGKTAATFTALADSATAALQAQHSDPAAEQLRLLNLDLQAISDEFIGEGEADEALVALGSLQKTWAGLQARTAAKNAKLALEFTAALSALQAPLNAGDEAAFKQAHAQARSLFDQVRKVLQ